jgi:hypothetical protein
VLSLIRQVLSRSRPSYLSALSLRLVGLVFARFPFAPVGTRKMLTEVVLACLDVLPASSPAWRRLVIWDLVWALTIGLVLDWVLLGRVLAFVDWSQPCVPFWAATQS